VLTTHSQLYAEPARLVSLGMLVEDQEEGGRRRRRYRLTDAGRSELDSWLSTPTDEGTELRDPAVLKLYFGGQANPDSVQRVALRAASVHRKRLAAYEALVASPPPNADVHQVAILALAARYEEEAVAFWSAVAVEPDLGA
jgi:DNA-binding PadR family transcriptional regulator